MITRFILISSIALTWLIVKSPAQPAALNPHLEMMRITGLLVGNGQTNTASLGSAFFLGRPYRANARATFLVLVTAKHVLNGFTGSNCAFVSRGEWNGEWKIWTMPLIIRDEKGQKLWVEHPAADVAAIKLDVPPTIPTASLLPNNMVVVTDNLIDDESVKRWHIGTGYPVFCLGYPNGFHLGAGFPVLKTGIISSYPLVPAAKNPEWACDFFAFGGNSGGPVYVLQDNPSVGGLIHVGVRVWSVVGLVSKRIGELGVALIVPAQFIRETVDMLPEPKLGDIQVAPDDRIGSIERPKGTGFTSDADSKKP